MRTQFELIVVFLALALWPAIQVQSAAQSQKGPNVKITNGPVLEQVTSDDAVIAWSTNVNASTILKYGTDKNNLNQTAEAPWGGTTHRVHLDDLKPDTTYFFRVESTQAQGTGTSAISDVGQFKTKAEASASKQDTKNTGSQSKNNEANVQILAGPIPQDLTDTSATIWWETNMPSSTILKFGTDVKNLETKEKPWGQQSHRVELTGLKPGTTYHVQIFTADGRQLASADFQTQPADFAQGNKFHITNGPVMESIADTQAVVAWSTNLRSSSVVRFGTDPKNLNQTAEAPWGETTHRVTLKNLKPGTQYWFQIQSSQAQGTGAQLQSQAFPFQTVNSGAAALKISTQH